MNGDRGVIGIQTTAKGLHQGRWHCVQLGTVLWLVVLLAAFGVSQAAASPGPRTALVIGNGAYEHATPLTNTLNDARDMASDLEALGFELIGEGPYKNTSLDVLIDAVDRFVGRLRERGGVGLLYYSGHGVQVNGRNYLVPVDAKLKRRSRVKYEAYALDDALNRMGGRGAGSVNLVILDACRDNPFLALRGSGDKGLARVSAPESTLILYATKPGATASDNLGGRNGLFTEHLRQALQRPDVDVETAFSEVVTGVYRASGHEQHPWKEGVLLSRFYFVPPRAGSVPPPPPPPQVRGYLQVIVDVDNAAVTVNGRSVGEASPGHPLNLSQGLPPGQVTVEVTADGYDSAQRVARIVANQWTQSVFTLVAKPTAPAPTPTLPLTVKTSPEGARVRILNIKPKYRDGIALKPSRYRIEVTHPGYQKHLSWHELKPGGELYTVELAPADTPVSRPEPVRRTDYEPEMVTIKSGCFQMGSPTSEANREKDERQRWVCIDGFRIGRYEVTQAQWRAVMGSNPSHFKGCDTCPVERVSWKDVHVYLERLNARTGKRYRLPTEAEWQYAVRAGTTTPFSTGRCINTDQANYNGNYDYNGCGAKTGVYREKTLPMGSLRPNPWGLYDMHGNVREWTCSAYDKGYGGGERRCVSEGHEGAVSLRGGSWSHLPWDVRSAARGRKMPDFSYLDIGFRLVQD